MGDPGSGDRRRGDVREYERKHLVPTPGEGRFRPGTLRLGRPLRQIACHPSPASLALACKHLAPEGVLGVWSYAESPTFERVPRRTEAGGLGLLRRACPRRGSGSSWLARPGSIFGLAAPLSEAAAPLWQPPALLSRPGTRPSQPAARPSRPGALPLQPAVLLSRPAVLLVRGPNPCAPTRPREAGA